MATQASPGAILALVQKLSDPDPDFRFMALNDLLQILTNAKGDLLVHDYSVAARTVDAIINTLGDQNGEVQNLAIKCLGPLVAKVANNLIAPMIEKLSSLKLENAVDNTVPALALRSVIIALPRPVPGLPSTPDVQSAYTAISRVLIPRLIGPGPTNKVLKNAKGEPVQGLLQNENDLNAESIDILIETVRCFGPLLEQIEVEAMQEVVIGILESRQGSSVVKKRAVVAVAMLAIYLDDKNLDGVVNRLLSGLSKSATSAVTRRLYISILGSMARSVPSRFGPHIAKAAPCVLGALTEDELQQHLDKISDGDDIGQDFNEVREAALVAIEAFLASCPQEMRPFTTDTIAASLRYLKYDPNYAVDDDEDMEEDQEDEEDDGDDEFDDDDGFEDDDDDASWKVRRCAAKTLYTLISSRSSGDLLENGVLYSQAAPPLIKRLSEREENVRLEVISALSLLVRKTGEGLHTAEFSLDEAELDVVSQAPVSRKRRRQSSAGNSAAFHMAGPGVTSPVLEKVPLAGPRADLARLTPSIIKSSAKHLQGKSVPTKQAILILLDDIVSVQRGGLADFFKELVGPVTEAIKASGSSAVSSSLAGAGGSASATPSTLRSSALKLISDISRTHSSSLLQPYLPKVVDGVIAAVHDRFYKISSEAIRTSEELIKAITPPRSRNAGTEFSGELKKLYDVIMNRGSANDADAEVRQRAIHALGVLVARTSSSEGAALLPTEQRGLALDVLKERLKNETTRLAAVRAVDNVAAFATTPGQLDKEWIQEVALELAGQLRKANRSLRGSSVVALKHLALSGATKGQLDSSTITHIVSALMPAITNSDTHLLGPALQILASIVVDHPDLVMTKEMVSALCDLLKGHFASLVLDQLLDFISLAGKTSAKDALMEGFLKEVSVRGDPAVVGKVIGTLLVTGGPSAGVTLDSFVQELQTSASNGDEDRICLALPVLGEATMRLGSQSPIKPSVFLEQFRADPDKVSLSAAVALGRAGSGNPELYLPVILETMQKGGNTQYFLIQSIKEVLSSNSAQIADLQRYSEEIWKQLLIAADKADNRVICAECVGRLAILDPQGFLPKLKTLLKDESAAVRGMAVQAVRYTLPESDEAFDAILRTVLVDMLLVMLQDADMEIKRLAMTTLNSAAHNKPDLILPHLGEMMPIVLSESVIKPELVREVMLGPFKHTVDDGLEVRKGAYETLYALMETAFSRINSIDFYDRVVSGLKDDNDIRQLCNLMVTKLIVIDPNETARRLDAIAEAYRTVLSHKLKDNAVKQEIEKQEEAQKSVLRVTMLLGDRMKAMTGNAGAATSNAAVAGVWTAYWEWVTKEFSKQLKALRDETNQLQKVKA
ncbi:hypothetical protein NLU13_9675 [Sarocladium strictum]|uniref:TATA-binding protein interacting (TIP20) domain-containing protein n=1 Tax=Sarocladium strictum TaxID=5046 RepID=A0AA39L4M9_SARSR|nr:hypothetical protein NLU13_9675 [Sarocladium strictum]